MLKSCKEWAHAGWGIKWGLAIASTHHGTIATCKVSEISLRMANPLGKSIASILVAACVSPSLAPRLPIFSVQKLSWEYNYMGLVSFPDPTLCKGKGSGDIEVFSWSCVIQYKPMQMVTPHQFGLTPFQSIQFYICRNTLSLINVVNRSWNSIAMFNQHSYMYYPCNEW